MIRGEGTSIPIALACRNADRTHRLVQNEPCACLPGLRLDPDSFLQQLGRIHVSQASYLPGFGGEALLVKTLQRLHVGRRGIISIGSEDPPNSSASHTVRSTSIGHDGAYIVTAKY